MTIADLARAEIRDLPPYEAAIQVDNTIRLNANEASWRNGADSFRRPLNRYPEIRPAKLTELLAKHYGCARSGLLVTRGSSEAIDLLLRVFCNPGVDNIVTVAPTFSMYAHYAIVQGAELRQVTTSREMDFAVAPAEILSACDRHTKLVFLCSPNNPTGGSIARADLLSILEGRSARSLIVVDEAYIEFSGSVSATELLDTYSHLVILRTLSKAHAFAGARCGSVLANKAVIDLLNAVQAPYALSTPVVECVESALRGEALANSERHIVETIAERERLADHLQNFSFVRHVWPSDANFLLAEVDDAAAMMHHCRDDKLLLRYFGGQLADCVRISVGSAQENNALLASLARMEARNG